MTAQILSAYELAAQALAAADPAETARLAGGVYDSEKGSVTIEMCGRPVAYLWNRQALIWADSGQAVTESPADLIILHYLQNATGAKPTGEWLAYRDLWGAKTQSGPFTARYQTRLAEAYDLKPSKILAAAKGLKAKIEKKKHYEAKVQVRFFPNIPILVNLSAGDNYLPPEAVFLYDAVIREYLPTEDCICVAEQLAKWLTE